MKNPVTRLILMLAFSAAGMFGFLSLFWFGGDVWLADTITPREVGMDTWVEEMNLSGALTAGAILAIDALWFVLAQWVWKVNLPRQADKRVWWYLLAAGAVVVAVAQGYFVAMETEGGFFPLPFLFYLATVVWGFYLATAYFSPVAFKYTPVGSCKLPRV